MNTARGFRFSLLTLVLLCALTGVSISHLITSRRLSTAESMIGEQREIVRELNHSLGHLVEEDLAFVQVKSFPRIPGRTEDGTDPFGVDWEIHFPHRNWRLFWAIAGVPKEGLPAKPMGSRDLDPQDVQWNELGFIYSTHRLLGRTIEFTFQRNEKWVCHIPADQADWLDAAARTWVEHAGPFNDFSGRSEIQQFSPDQPIVLYRERLMSVKKENGNITSENPDPCPGLIIWLEAVSDSTLEKSP